MPYPLVVESNDLLRGNYPNDANNSYYPYNAGNNSNYPNNPYSIKYRTCSV